MTAKELDCLRQEKFHEEYEGCAIDLAVVEAWNRAWEAAIQFIDTESVPIKSVDCQPICSYPTFCSSDGVGELRYNLDLRIDIECRWCGRWMESFHVVHHSNETPLPDHAVIRLHKICKCKTPQVNPTT